MVPCALKEKMNTNNIFVKERRYGHLHVEIIEKKSKKLQDLKKSIK